MFFYSKEFFDHESIISDKEIRTFLDSINDIKSEDKLENVRDSIKEVFDNVKITKLDYRDIIEFQIPYIKEKTSMTFEEMDIENVNDGFLNKAIEISHKFNIKEEKKIEDESSSDNVENFKFFHHYIKLYFGNLESIDAGIINNLENWDFGRISIVDKIILRMGIIELKYFTEIPPKVTINEAIELGKKYSTEKSNIFINGLLNKLKDEIRGNDKQLKN
ncbi:MAG: transcription antitermination factor NusB [Candidatus Delongbacteria bacterium]|nr:transcription antitermination factor NusB [Candidatus Delongbacteria bacterium]MCG2761055.1 transcription antitermination factor NusB [Candidatus Delongbacteria bacterium]